ncbi:MAG TPA: rhomboid family intramembrane serine protease, partial [Cyclobacteriaceae bacterium]|nr:rhomboid family intramembrane serine protease [Cyclobacteriaceae bacterium]
STTIVLVTVTIAASLLAWNNQDITRKWIFNPYSIHKYNQYFRFITSGFIHANWVHLLFNVFMLYMFGEIVERYFKFLLAEAASIVFVIFYLSAIVISSLSTYLKHRHNPGYNSLGASGGVSAVLFSFIVFAPMQDLCLYGLLCLPGIFWGAAYLVYSYYMAKRSGDNINHDAHFFGALYGIIFTIIIYPSAISNFINSLY